MSFRIRGAAVAVLAALACLIAGASASALTVSPSGTYSATSGTVTWRSASNGQALTCSRSSRSFTVAADGFGSAAAGSTIFTSCGNPLLGMFTFVQTVAWPVQVQLHASPLGVGITWTIPTDGLEIGAPGCTYWVGGSIVSRASAAALPAAITPSTPVPIVSGSLAVTRNNRGPLCAFNPVGLAMAAGATFFTNRTMTVSG